MQCLSWHWGTHTYTDTNQPNGRYISTSQYHTSREVHRHYMPRAREESNWDGSLISLLASERRISFAGYMHCSYVVHLIIPCPGQIHHHDEHPRAHPVPLHRFRSAAATWSPNHRHLLQGRAAPRSAVRHCCVPPHPLSSLFLLSTLSVRAPCLSECRQCQRIERGPGAMPPSAALFPRRCRQADWSPSCDCVSPSPAVSLLKKSHSILGAAKLQVAVLYASTWY
jgi:hypothetical protein